MTWKDNTADGNHGRRYRIYRYASFRLMVKTRGRWQKLLVRFEAFHLAQRHAEEMERSHGFTDMLNDNPPRLDAAILEKRSPWLSLVSRGEFPKGMGA